MISFQPLLNVLKISWPENERYLINLYGANAIFIIEYLIVEHGKKK